jgi:hypothetical protein
MFVILFRKAIAVNPLGPNPNRPGCSEKQPLDLVQVSSTAAVTIYLNERLSD